MQLHDLIMRGGVRRRGGDGAPKPTDISHVGMVAFLELPGPKVAA
jgi:hypothetical protein